MYDKYVAPIFAQYNIKVKYGVQPIADIHLKSDFDQEPEELGSMSYIYIFTSVALFMLLIACINYMNLTTARSARRAKEIGIRKVAGSTRPQLIAQFMTESVVLTVISLLISLGLLYFLLPLFNSLAGKFLSYKNILQPVSLLVLFGIVVFVGVLGGSYPALYLSKFNSVSVLKGTLSKASANVALRRVLVTVQFSISMVMIICTWVVYSQLNFMKEKDLGFNKDQVLSFTITANGNVRAGAVGMMDEIRKNPHVVSVSSANAPPGSPNVFFNLFSIETSEGFREKGVDTYSIDGKYLDALGIKLVKGRNFTIPADTLNSVIVNESMVKAFGWRDQPLGKKIKFPGDTSNRHLEVVGVIQDFHQKSLYNPISPLLLFHRPILRTFLVKISPGHIPETLKELENTWKKFYPEQPFSFTFMDDDFNSQYAADQKRGKIFTSFSLLTILITCLGLIGLIAFTTEQRQKEISIRKVMGAGTTQIVPLIAKNFVMMVCISCLIAFPIAWYFMNKWMEVFPYKVGLQASAFILSALLVLFITVVTISFHTIKVAIANPVKSLRTE